MLESESKSLCLFLSFEIFRAPPSWILFTSLLFLKVHLCRDRNGYPEIMLFRLIKMLKERSKRKKQ